MSALHTNATGESRPTRKLAPGPGRLKTLTTGAKVIPHPFKVLEESTKYGPVVRYGTNSKRVLHLIHQPEHIEHVLLKNNKNYEKSSPYALVKTLFGRGLLFNEGESWFAQRRLLQPTFLPKHFPILADGVQEAIASSISEWRNSHGGHKTDIEQEMAHLARRMIGFTLFGSAIPDDINRVLNLGESKVSFLLGNLPLTPHNIYFRASMKGLDKSVYRMIADRRANMDGDHTDILHALITAIDKDTGEGMSEQQLRDEIVTLLFSGFDTTSRTLTWCFHALSINPHCEARLHQELDEVLGGRTPTYEDLPKLKYTTMLVQETMRMYPPNVIIGRQAKGDDEIGGYHIPAGSFITLSPYLAHRNPDVWENPELFNPERFAEGKEAQLPRFAYFPFGGGPRQCIGKGLAMMTIPMAIATVAQQYQFYKAPNFEVKHDMRMTFQSKNGVPATRHLRTALNN